MTAKTWRSKKHLSMFDLVEKLLQDFKDGKAETAIPYAADRRQQAQILIVDDPQYANNHIKTAITVANWICYLQAKDPHDLEKIELGTTIHKVKSAMYIRDKDKAINFDTALKTAGEIRGFFQVAKAPGERTPDKRGFIWLGPIPSHRFSFFKGVMEQFLSFHGRSENMGSRREEHEGGWYCGFNRDDMEHMIKAEKKSSRPPSLK